MKKFISLLIAVMMVVALMPMAMASSDYSFDWDGSKDSGQGNNPNNLDKMGVATTIKTITFSKSVDLSTVTDDTMYFYDKSWKSGSSIFAWSDDKTVATFDASQLNHETLNYLYINGLKFEDGTDVTALTDKSVCYYISRGSVAPRLYSANENLQKVTSAKVYDWTNQETSLDGKSEIYSINTFGTKIDVKGKLLLVDLGASLRPGALLIQENASSNETQWLYTNGTKIYGLDSLENGMADADLIGTIDAKGSCYKKFAVASLDSTNKYRYIVIDVSDAEFNLIGFTLFNVQYLPSVTVENQEIYHNGTEASLPIKLTFANTDMTTVTNESVQVINKSYGWDQKINSVITADAENANVVYLDRKVLPSEANAMIQLTSAVKSVDGLEFKNKDLATFYTGLNFNQDYNASKYFTKLTNRNNKVATVTDGAVVYTDNAAICDGKVNVNFEIAPYNAETDNGQYVLIDLGNVYDIASVGMLHSGNTNNDEIHGVQFKGSKTLVGIEDAEAIGTIVPPQAANGAEKHDTHYSTPASGQYRYIYAYITPEQVAANQTTYYTRNGFYATDVTVAVWFDRGVSQNDIFFKYTDTTITATPSNVESGGAIVMVARYEKATNKFVDVVIGQNNQAVTVDYDANYNYKAFLWDDPITNMIPFAPAVNY